MVGSVIGVFALPSALAGFGPISLIAFVLVTVGGVALALAFGALNRRRPGSGGPYLYARDAGLRSIGAVQVVTTVLKFLPLLFMATVGLLFIKPANFGAFNAGGGSALGAISAAAAIALFSYIGIETASVAAGRVREPGRTVGRATILGTLACAVVYILGTLTVFGPVPHAALVGSSATFTDSANAIFGGSWAGEAIAVAAIVSGFGALVGWSLIVGEMPRAAARDRLFPARFAHDDRHGVPAFGIITATTPGSATRASPSGTAATTSTAYRPHWRVGHPCHRTGRGDDRHG